jgi:hypothetical protein
MFSFEEWLEELDRLAQAEGLEGSYVEQTGTECWLESYELGVTPAEAWEEEKSCAWDS